ncbi:hypothetical protein B296_00046496, partial [Ensete ventricosum]
MDVLIHFLVNNKLDALKHPDTSAAKLVLQLFRFLFMAAAKAPADSERILQPHIPVIMDVCMKNATEVEKPLGYMHLLRYMFRSMNGAKFDTLLRDLIPSLQPCLNMLLSMLEGPSGEEMRDLILELCLTLPARLSSLLPHIPRLMKPLVLALKGSDDLVSLGLRTLEFWIDSLNPDFLEPSMANVISEVILALWSHLRPLPYPWGTKALQLLGKLGGRNRRFLREPLALECKENPEHGLRLILTFEPSTPFLVPLDRCIYLAVASVMQNNGGMEAFYRKQALKFLRVCLSSLLNLRGNVQGEGVSPGTLGTLLVSSVDPSRRRTETSDMKVCLKSRGSTSNLKELDPLIFLDALVEVLASENRLHAKAALNALSMFAETLLFLARAKHNGVLSSRGGPDLKTPNHTELRAKIISMFFKSLTCRTPEIVSVAKEGLRQLGVKLLDHLKKWLEPEKLAQTQKSWKAGDEPKLLELDAVVSSKVSLIGPYRCVDILSVRYRQDLQCLPVPGHTGSSGYRYVDRSLLGGSAKNRRSIEEEIGCRQSIEREIDRQRSIGEEKGKKRKRRKTKRRRKNTSPAHRHRPRVARACSRFFSHVRRWSVSPCGEKDRGD